MSGLLIMAAVIAGVSLLIVGTPIFFFARRRLNASLAVATALAAVLSPISIAATLWVTNECMLSRFMRKQLPSMLTKVELATLRGEDLFCSTAFSFERRGKRATAFVVTGLFRDKIYIADDTSP
jgi:hypothetical protein